MFSSVDLDETDTTNRSDRQSKRKLTFTLLQSEIRRCALTECLKTAWCALKEQRERISKKNMEMVNHSTIIDSMILKQKLLEAKIGLLHKEEGSRYEGRLNEARRHSELQDRIWCLEEEIQHFNHRLEPLALKGKDSLSTISWYPRENSKKHDLHQLPSHLVSAKIGKTSLETQMSDLHTQLFQTKCENYGLKMQYLESNSQLTANRNIDENFPLEMTRLKQDLQSLEQQILNLQSEKTLLSSQLKTLASEHQQTFNEKELLLETLKEMKHFKCSDSLSMNQSNGRLGVIDRAYRHRASLPEFNGSEERHEQDYQEQSLNARVSSRDCQEIPFKSCQQCNLLTRNLGLAKAKTLFICLGEMEDGKEGMNAVSNSAEATGVEQQRSGEETDWQPGIVTMLRQDPQENGKAWKKSTHSVEGLQLPNVDLIKTQNSIHLQFEKVLEEIEGFVKLNLKLEYERNQVLCKLGMQTAEAKRLELSSEQNRKQLLHLLSQNIVLRHENHIKVNQLTVLIIELHHLRKAYRALSQTTDCPEDILSADWINRLRLIKSTVKKIKTQQLNLHLLKKENEELMEKSGQESLQNMDTK